MGVREVEVAGRKLAIHESDDTSDAATGKALTGSWLWDSALYLAEWMASDDRAHLELSGKTVLELGAGTGLPGLAAAALGAARVVLTDVGPLLPGLRKNVETNGLGDQVWVKELRWGSEESLEWLAELGLVDVVLMSDVFYDAEEMAGLAKTLRLVCGATTVVRAASEVRASVGECLAALSREGLETVQLQERNRQLVRCPQESSLFAIYLVSTSQNPNVTESRLYGS